ncbi:hypothetical protein [Actinomadura sp. DC4]|uniref:LppU/SCO3897 family protein n=1 Tax=Actinomadura sp. DC4 TaxID=3055069 RepID=UPI0025B24FD8|nr:hypothetical protein [Actinomadura sp. DC4]MDN3355323.1 hypothetical protein [Actinomadura sp. DC4]
MHEHPEAYGQQPYPNQPQGQGSGGHPPQQPPYPGQQPPSYPNQQQPPYPGQQQQQPPYGQQPAYGPPPQPGGGTPWGQPPAGGFGPQDPMGPGGWGPPPGPPGKNNSGPVVAVAAVAALVLLGGGGAIIWALSGDDGKKPTTPIAVSTPPTSVPTFSPPTSFPSAFPTPTFPSFPTPSSSSTSDESMFVQAGDCVRITGKSPHLEMHKATCGSAPYKVLKRYSGTADKTRCRGVSGYTTAFWATNKKYSFLSYVLCLKRQ